MASSVIKVLPVKTDAISVTGNPGVADVSSAANRIWGSVVQFRIEFATKQRLSLGTEYVIGYMTGKVPKMITYIHVVRRDSGSENGLCKLPTISGDQITISPLIEIPSGIIIVVAGTYITD